MFLLPLFEEKTQKLLYRIAVDGAAGSPCAKPVEKPVNKRSFPQAGFGKLRCDGTFLCPCGNSFLPVREHSSASDGTFPVG
jgi:hypothetical protein